MFLLVLVLVPHLGRKINGARRWFDFHGVRFQPSELGKIALIIMLAWYGDRYQRQMQTWKRGIVFPGALVALVLGLVFVEPDRGTTILLAAVSGAMLLVAGVRWKYIVPPVLLGAAGLAVSLLHDPMRLRRIFSWWDLEQHKDGVGYQAYQAMIALGSGGWTGLGLGNGRQKLGFVPEDHTDFIFSIIGEELGLVATLLVILAFVIIAICGVYIALRARETYGSLLALGRHVFDQPAGGHQHRRGHQRAAQQGPAAAVHQLWRFEPARHADVRRLVVQCCPACARAGTRPAAAVIDENPFAAKAT